MPVKVMCAGCPKDEREPAEAAVKAALSQATGTWTVSLVKIGQQWSLSIDGPEVRHKTMVVPDGGIKQAIQELLKPPAPAPPPPRAPSPTVAPARAPAPSAPAPRAPAAAPVSKPIPVSPAPVPPAARPVTPATPMPRAPLPPTRPAPAPAPRSTPDPTPSPGKAPLAPTRSPSRSPRGAGEHQDRYECQFCGGAFVVIYESTGSSGEETVAVACPHCWKNSHVMVAEEAALSRDYRAEKA